MAGPWASCTPDIVSIPPPQAETAALLRRLAGTEPVETHISLVYRGRDMVWKLKKAVRLAFLDFTRVDDRRHFAERELVLNAPAAPGLYHDVVPVVRGNDGALALGGATDQPVVDWVLRMARVPDGAFLDEIAAAGRLDAALLDATADAVAAYHASLPPVSGVLPSMRGIASGNGRAALEAGLPAGTVRIWEDAILTALDLVEPWLEARAEAGFVRRAHGDLHLGNLCLWRGQPVPFDALEFDEALATIDVAYDLAFLLMDLDQRVDRASANRVLNRYVARTGDAALVRGLSVFISMRAMVRAHVDARTGKMESAAAYLVAAIAALRPPPPVVVGIGGLPGSGKSTLARALAPDLGGVPGALVLRSDEIRKRLQGVAPEQRLPARAYLPAASDAVFATLATAVTEAAHGHAVIADATFMGGAHRRMLEQAAAAARVPFHGFWLQAPLTELERRIARRSGDASDATVDVLRAAVPRDPGAGDWVAIDATNTDEALGLAKASLTPHLVSR